MEQRLDLLAIRSVLEYRRIGLRFIAVFTKHRRPEYRRKTDKSNYFVPNVYRWGNVTLSFPQTSTFGFVAREVGEPHPFPHLLEFQTFA